MGFAPAQGGSGALASEVQGTAASGAAAAGNPVQVGGVDNAGDARSLAVDSQGRPILGSGEQHVGQVGGSTVNPSDTFTRPADTTQYAVGDLVANSTASGSVVPLQFSAARVAAGSFAVVRARLRKSGTGTTAAAFRLHLFSSAPTVTNGDNGAFVPSASADYLGAIDIAVNRACSDGAVGAGVPVVGNAICVKLAAGQVIYGLLEALNTYTPVSAEGFSVTLEVLQD